MSGTKETLSDLYDGPSVYTRKVGVNTFTIRGACLSILAASQTQWFLEKLKAGDVRGGFLARFTFWPAFAKAYVLPIPPDPDSAIGARLLAGLNDLRRVHGPMELPADVRTRTARGSSAMRRNCGESTGWPTSLRSGRASASPR